MLTPRSAFVSTRPLFALALAGLLAGCGPAPRVVLVHGAWSGAWTWDGVAAELRKAGMDVTAVDLPAHGQDQSAVSGATLDAYVAAVGQAVDAREEPVYLVGHSMAGMVISQYAERSPVKVKELVYLAAYLPADGQSLTDLAYTDADSHLGPALTVDADHGVGKLPQDQLQDIFCADCASSDVAALRANYRDEPLAPLGTPVSLTAASWGAVKKAYVFTTADHAVSYTLQQRMAGAVTLAGSETLDTSHAPFLSKPVELSGALQRLFR